MRKVSYNLLKVHKKKIKLWLIAALCLFIFLPLAWILAVKLEGEKPSIFLGLPSPYIGNTQEIPVSVSDSKSGVKKIWIGLKKDEKEVVVLEKEYPRSGLLGGGKMHQETFNVNIEPRKMGISDGKAVLRMVAIDFSWRKWWNGNRVYLEKEVTIDTKSPVIEVMSRIHNISQGGSGLVIYRLSESCQKSGVYVGENFYPGYSGYFEDADISMALFALSYDQDPGTEIFVKATDFSGNNSRTGFSYYIKKKRFKKDVVEITDKFLKLKMNEFDDQYSKDPNTPLIDKFIQVNRELRKTNHAQIEKLVKKTEKEFYWNGAFLRLPKSARKAGFADDRKYKYNGRVIDRQVHLGVDLASITHSPVPAANRGKVVFAGDIGIYGKTVIVDHGFGLFSTYSHMSNLIVDNGQMVSKEEIIGRTGNTGLAGGDHLHFGMLVDSTFVNPIEWWDDSWIKNNILEKIKTVKSYKQ